VERIFGDQPRGRRALLVSCRCAPAPAANPAGDDRVDIGDVVMAVLNRG
jgi:hypothetical protein